MPAVTETFFDERLTVAVPVDFRDAVRSAADRRRVTMADYARLALAEQMGRDGIEHRAPPTLSQAPSASDAAMSTRSGQPAPKPFEGPK